MFPEYETSMRRVKGKSRRPYEFLRDQDLPSLAVILIG